MKLLLAFLLLASSVYSVEVRLKDIARIEGLRENHISGYGIVVGLPGSGDTKNFITQESLKNYLKNLGVTSSNEKSQLRNTASVIVTAKIQSGARVGDKIDVTVSSLGDAKSLEGGVLIQTPLKSIGGETYAVAGGVISFGGKELKNRFASRTMIHTVGAIYKGGIIEKEIPSVVFDKNGRYKLIMEDQDFTTLNSTKDVLEKELKLITKVISPTELEIVIPETSRENPLPLLSSIEKTTVNIESKARVVINERTGVIVMGSNVTIDEVAISKQGLNVMVKKPEKIADTGDIKTSEGMVVVQEATRVSDLVDALNKMGASTKDIIAILEALKKAGALHAEVSVQ